MRKVESESWLGRMGLVRGSERRKGGAAEPTKAATVGVLTFEVAGLMSKAVQLWHALADDRVARLSDEVLRLEGVRKLVSDDREFLLALAVAEMTDAIGSLARAVAHLGWRSCDPALQRFDAAYADLVKTGADPRGFEYAGRKIEGKVKKMEGFVAASADLHNELEVLAELEQELRRMLANPDDSGHLQGSVDDFKNKVLWQRRQVKDLRQASLWDTPYDFVVRLLGRSLFSIVGRIRQVFRFQFEEEATGKSGAHLARCHSIAGSMPLSVHCSHLDAVHMFASGPTTINRREFAGQCLPATTGSPPPARKRQNSRTWWPVRRGPFGDCMVGGDKPAVLLSCIPLETALRKSIVTPLALNRADGASAEANLEGDMVNINLFVSMIEPRFQLLIAPASTLGGAALALHYANVIIVIDNLAASPHWIGPNARDDLYNMLTTSIKAALRAKLRTFAKTTALSVYDPVLAAEWSAAVRKKLEWLAPLAHNMIRWHSDRSFERQSLASSSTVLLLQTLYFADRKKTEDAITELLVDLNYLWRYRRDSNAETMSNCVSSRQFDGCLQIQVDVDACSAT
ncbi:protein PSK SIMULATOR 1-like [Musa acuminata AAA Group]|uniref:protein PSK SIMULATOR 1-like n=1 Tax=Musa acuminata AAA Group TaxID=214697 RepID=UPI0031E1D594